MVRYSRLFQWDIHMPTNVDDDNNDDEVFMWARPPGLPDNWEVVPIDFDDPKYKVERQKQPVAGLLAIMDRMPEHARLSLRHIRKNNLMAVNVLNSYYSNELLLHIPSGVNFNDIDASSYYSYSLNRFASGDSLPHSLAGEKNRDGVPWDLARCSNIRRKGDQEDADCDTEGLHPGYWEPWRLLYNTGLVGFPLLSRLPNLYRWSEDAYLGLIASIMLLRMERLGRRLVDRATTLAALELLSQLDSGVNDPRGITSASDVEPPPQWPPRSPGVDSPGLYAPRC